MSVTLCEFSRVHWNQKLEVSASSGRAGAMGETTGHPTVQAILQAAGPIGCYYKKCLQDVLFPNPRSWILIFRRFIP